MALGSRPLLDFLPDETLFSLVTRMHRLWGHHVAAQTSKLLFGHARGGTQHDFPNRLRAFCDRTQGAYGNAERLANDATLLRYYRAFLPRAEIDHAAAAMGGDTVAHLKLRLGILTSRFRAHHPLKACRECMTFDRQQYGWAYWHLEHQYPGVWTCPKHPEHLLDASKLKINGVARFQWLMPDETHLVALPVRPSQPSLRQLRTLSSRTVDLVRLAHRMPITLEHLRHALLDAFERQGWVTESGRLRLGRASADLATELACLRSIPELQALPRDAADAAKQLGKLLRVPRTGTHPIRYVALTAWALANLGDIEQGGASGVHRTRPEAAADEFGDPELDRSYERAVVMINEGRSARAAAQELGVDTKTVIVWAGRAGLAVGSRPKKLTPDLRQHVRELLRRGQAPITIASATALSPSTVNVVLYSDAQLLERHRQAIRDQRFADARQEWHRAIRGAGKHGVTAARQRAPAAYAWLRRNERDWLERSRATVHAAPLGSSEPRVDWGARDADLYARIKVAARQLKASDGAAEKLMLWQLCQLVPDLRSRLRRLDRLPKTRQLVDRLVPGRSARRGGPALRDGMSR